MLPAPRGRHGSTAADGPWCGGPRSGTARQPAAHRPVRHQDPRLGQYRGASSWLAGDARASGPGLAVLPPRDGERGPLPTEFAARAGCQPGEPTGTDIVFFAVEMIVDGSLGGADRAPPWRRAGGIQGGLADGLADVIMAVDRVPHPRHAVRPGPEHGQAMISSMIPAGDGLPAAGTARSWADGAGCCRVSLATAGFLLTACGHLSSLGRPRTFPGRSPRLRQARGDGAAGLAFGSRLPPC